MRSASVSPSTSSITSARTGAAFLEAMDRGDVRVVERGEHLRFALEARQALRIGGKHLGQDLQGDVPPEPRVAGAIHLAHPTRAERTDDFVKANALASGQCHVCCEPADSVTEGNLTTKVTKGFEGHEEEFFKRAFFVLFDFLRAFVVQAFRPRRTMTRN